MNQALPLPTYSFADVHCVLTGPGASLSLADGSGSAEEGLNFEPTDERNKMTIGAEGSGMFSLSQNRSGKITVRILKTSPLNGALQTMMNYQSSSSLFTGKNILNLANPVTGDKLSASGVAFGKQPSIRWGKEGDMLEWEFLAIRVSVGLGGQV